MEGLGLTMPENPHNSIDILRAELGVGILSPQGVFDDGEFNDEGRQA